MTEKNITAGVVMGSRSDEDKLEKCMDVFKQLQIPFEVNIMSAHRTPDKVAEYAKNAESRGLKVIVAAAGLSAALPGVLASHTNLPVIGIPIASGALNGVDALYSIAQMPPGIPVGCVGIDNAKNAALLAARILALDDNSIKRGLEKIKKEFGDIQA
ncbi:MAG: 5-(carboxyamino)imidazole ribonucleotide mutase [bacterium]